jgi:hypothetical protein
LETPIETSSFKFEEVTDEHNVESEPETEPEPKISQHALTGWSSPKTMRVAVKIRSLEVVALINSDSTHNFISERVARLLRLPVVVTHFWVPTNKKNIYNNKKKKKKKRI